MGAALFLKTGLNTESSFLSRSKMSGKKGRSKKPKTFLGLMPKKRKKTSTQKTR